MCGMKCDFWIHGIGDAFMDWLMHLPPAENRLIIINAHCKTYEKTKSCVEVLFGCVKSRTSAFICFARIYPTTILLLCHQFCREWKRSIFFPSNLSRIQFLVFVLIFHLDVHFVRTLTKKNKKVFQPFVSASHFHLAVLCVLLHESLISSIYFQRPDLHWVHFSVLFQQRKVITKNAEFFSM